MVDETLKRDIMAKQAQANLYHQNASQLNGLIYHLHDPRHSDPNNPDYMANPATGKPYTSDEVKQLELQRDHAWGQYEKLVGIDKESKGALQKAKGIIDFLHGQRKAQMQPPPGMSQMPGETPGQATGNLPTQLATNAPSLAGGQLLPGAPGQRGGTMPPPPLTRGQEAVRAAAALPFETHGARVQQGIADEQQVREAQMREREHVARDVLKMPEDSREFRQFVATGAFPNLSRLQTGLQMKQRQVLGSDLSPEIPLLSGEDVDPKQRYDIFEDRGEPGKFVAMPSGYLGGEAPNTPWKAFKKSREDKGMPLDKIVDDYNTHYSSTTGTRIIKDADNNYVEVPVTSGKKEQRGTPISSGPSSAPLSVTTPQGNASPLGSTPSGGSSTSTRGGLPSPPRTGGGAGRARPILSTGGEQVHAPLSQAAKTGLFQIRSTEGMIDTVRPELEAVVKDIGRGGNIWDSTQQRSAWEQYTKLGLDPSNIDPNSVATLLPTVDPRLAKLLPTLAMLQIIGAQPYLRSVRRFEFVKQIQQHLPDPEKDTPQLMLEKLNQLQRNLPGLEKALMESEGIKQANAPVATTTSAPAATTSTLPGFKQWKQSQKNP
jgi:hypothetical protein